MTDRKGPIIFRPYTAFSGMRKAFEMGNANVLKSVDEAGLRGRGGAGFPVAMKWKFALADIKEDHTGYSEERFIVCNADEGEPGTFKDRVLLEEYFELLLEGMIIAGYTIRASTGLIYLRGEYAFMWDRIKKIIIRWREEGKLGENLDGKGFNFDIHIRMGAGAYVCGEETALIESMEGYRGEPRNRPPFPVNAGFNNRPTVVNNVETLCLLPHIMNDGAEWFKKIGTAESAGSKLLSVSGDCGKPGVYEVPYGTTVQEVLELTGAVGVKAVQVGGASGVCLNDHEFNRRICFEDVSTGGSIIIFNTTRSMRDVLVNFLGFFMEESCGQCTPCRYGTECLLDGVLQLSRGEVNGEYLAELVGLAETMTIASKCGLGQSVANPFHSIIEKFRGEVIHG